MCEFLSISKVTQVTEFSSDVYSRTGASLLDSIAMVHPFVISILINRISDVIETNGEVGVVTVCECVMCVCESLTTFAELRVSCKGTPPEYLDSDL